MKADLEKASLAWVFIGDTLSALDIPRNLCEVIVDCITTQSLQVMWNGEATDAFSMGCGIRQGCPLSPYIFVLCIERLGHLIAQKTTCYYSLKLLLDIYKWRRRILERVKVRLSGWSASTLSMAGKFADLILRNTDLVLLVSFNAFSQGNIYQLTLRLTGVEYAKGQKVSPRGKPLGLKERVAYNVLTLKLSEGVALDILLLGHFGTRYVVRLIRCGFGVSRLDSESRFVIILEDSRLLYCRYDMFAGNENSRLLKRRRVLT
ncbi:hypothetical protein CRG98_031191 [Punica granatum]|uniref:Uncharacterized protein n=1 Tax=Punica granatum TaxID=22663 RepID=A0A2I0IYB0_PUNGR|nr:hypothetical protein CRG98_031191 [Punica granatum]